MNIKEQINTTIIQYINENINLNDIQYNTIEDDEDEDRIKIIATINDINVGSVVMEFLFDSYSYEFSDLFNEDEFYEIYPDDKIAKIEHIEINDNFKNLGVGGILMKKIINLAKRKGYKQFYLNASPMGFKGLNKQQLVNFYKKFGFKTLLDQGNNVIMGMTF